MIQERVQNSINAVNDGIKNLSQYDDNDILGKIMKQAFTFQTLVYIESEIRTEYCNPGIKAFFNEFYSHFDEEPNEITIVMRLKLLILLLFHDLKQTRQKNEELTKSISELQQKCRPQPKVPSK